MSLFEGSGVAIVTPFIEDRINYDVLEELVEFQIENETDAIIVCGTTGEASTMNGTEQIDCIKFVVDKVAKRVPVIAGTGSNNTYHAIEVSKKAEEVGVDGLLLVTPYYNKTTQNGLISHYTTIAESVSVPIILYNVPSRTGMSINPETVYELSKIENVVGLKEASGNLSNIAKVADMCGDKIDIYSGNDDQIVPIMSLGGKGVISVLANILPRQTHYIAKNYMDGNIEKARELQLKYLKLINLIFSETNPIPVKEALNIIGFEVGDPRLPLTKMSQKNIDLMICEMKNLQMI